MYGGNPGEIDFGSSSARFELARVLVIGSQLYFLVVRGKTVVLTFECVE